MSTIKWHILKLLTDEGDDLPKLIQVWFGFQNPQQQQKTPKNQEQRNPKSKPTQNISFSSVQQKESIF